MQKGRPLQFNPEQAITKATELFWQKGYEASSTAELMSVMNLSKSSLYQTFKSKQALFDLCLEQYGNTASQSMRTALKQADSAKQFIVDTFQSFTQPCDNANKGCMLVNTTCEIGSSDPSVNKLIQKRIEKHREIFQSAIEQAQQTGDIAKDKNAYALSSFLMSSICGLVVMVKMDKQHPGIEPIVKQVLMSLD